MYFIWVDLIVLVFLDNGVDLTNEVFGHIFNSFVQSLHTTGSDPTAAVHNEEDDYEVDDVDEDDDLELEELKEEGDNMDDSRDNLETVITTIKEAGFPAKLKSSSEPLGLKVADIDRDNPSMAEVPDGVIVSRVNSYSPASGELFRGDIITMIQHKGKKYEVVNVESFNNAIEMFTSGDKIAIHLTRSGNRLIRSITLS